MPQESAGREKSERSSGGGRLIRLTAFRFSRLRFVPGSGKNQGDQFGIFRTKFADFGIFESVW